MWAGETAADLLLRKIGAQVDAERDRGRAREGFAQDGRQCVEGAAFDAVTGDHGIAARGVAAEAEHDVLERLAGEAGAEDVRSSLR